MNEIIARTLHVEEKDPHLRPSGVRNPGFPTQGAVLEDLLLRRGGKQIVNSFLNS